MKHAHLVEKSAVFRLMQRALASNYFLFFFVTAGFALWRHGAPLVWDDTSVYKIAYRAWQVGGREDWISTFLSYIVPAFSAVSPSGYRPVAGLIQSLFILTIDSPFPTWGHLLFVGCCIGGLAVAFKSIASRFISSRPIVYVCLALFMFSSPMAQSSWISYSGIPALVPLFTCIGLLIYFDVLERPAHAWAKLLLLSVLVIVSSWYREFMIALPLTILAMEIMRARRVTAVSVMAAGLIGLCLYPTAIPHLLFQVYAVFSGYDMQPGDKGTLANALLLPVRPVFHLGNVQTQLSGAMSGSGIVAIKEEVSRHLLSIVSPSLIVLAFIGFAALVVERIRRRSDSAEINVVSLVGVVVCAAGLAIGLMPLAATISRGVGVSWPYHFTLLAGILGFVGIALFLACRRLGVDVRYVVPLMALVAGLVALAGAVAPRVTLLWPLFSLWPYHLGVLALLLVAWDVDRRLAIWMAIFLGPFYLVYTERVHLAYVLMPLSIVAAMVLEQCWSARQFGRRLRPLVRYAAGVAITVGVLDAGANPIVVHRVMTGISDGIEVVAEKLTHRQSNRPIAIIGNALHVDDLRLYLDGRYQLLWTIPSGHDRPHDVTDTPQRLTGFLKAKLSSTDVYFLDTRQDFIPFKKHYHQHRFVAACSVAMDDLGTLHQTRVEYFMPDPLRWFVNREYFAFLGPPDLVDDFYYGPSRRPLFGKVEAEYHLYRVTSPKVNDWFPMGPTALVDGNFLGFSIVAQDDRFFAIPTGEGGFAYERVCRKDYSRSFMASNLDELKAMIRRMSAAR